MYAFCLCNMFNTDFSHYGPYSDEKRPSLLAPKWNERESSSLCYRVIHRIYVVDGSETDDASRDDANGDRFAFKRKVKSGRRVPDNIGLF
jgi:hypothetical protein